jgi:hypothetical protein
MTEEGLPKLTEATIPVQTHTLRVDERIAKEKAKRDIASRRAQMEWKTPTKSEYNSL